ncbi:MAG: hypothetical protein AAFY91_12740, partial [Bacteroidota bacterium]
MARTSLTSLDSLRNWFDLQGQTVILEELKKIKSPSELTDYINLLANSGGSAVMFAAAGGHVDAAKQLMELGANINDIARERPGYREKLEKMIAEGQVQED